jgi:hypothetical protein
MKLKIVSALALALVGHAGAQLSQTELCGDWQPDYDVGNKCTPGQVCIGDTGTTFITQETMAFASDGTYIKKYRLATGGCPIADDSGTLIMSVDTLGFYTLGDVSSVDADYTEITYTPTSFTVGVFKNNKAMFYTYDNPSPCEVPVTFLNDPAIGCPCNLTWGVDATAVNSEPVNNTGVWTIEGTIKLTKNASLSEGKVLGNFTECPVGTCPDEYFFNSDIQYGAIRFSNVTTVVQDPVSNLDVNVTSGYLDVTRTNTNQAIGFGYATPEILYSFKNSGEGCQRSADPEVLKDTEAPTTAPTTTAPTSAPTEKEALNPASRAPVRGLAMLAAALAFFV